jgi:hypothetical protein
MQRFHGFVGIAGYIFVSFGIIRYIFVGTLAGSFFLPGKKSRLYVSVDKGTGRLILFFFCTFPCCGTAFE